MTESVLHVCMLNEIMFNVMLKTAKVIVPYVALSLKIDLVDLLMFCRRVMKMYILVAVRCQIVKNYN